MYRIIYRDGTFVDLLEPSVSANAGGSPVWALLDLDITDGGDAYQQVLSTLEVDGR